MAANVMFAGPNALTPWIETNILRALQGKVYEAQETQLAHVINVQRHDTTLIVAISDKCYSVELVVHPEHDVADDNDSNEPDAKPRAFLSRGSIVKLRQWKVCATGSTGQLRLETTARRALSPLSTGTVFGTDAAGKSWDINEAIEVRRWMQWLQRQEDGKNTNGNGSTKWIESLQSRLDQSWALSHQGRVGRHVDNDATTVAPVPPPLGDVQAMWEHDQLAGLCAAYAALRAHETIETSTASPSVVATVATAAEDPGSPHEESDDARTAAQMAPFSLPQVQHRANQVAQLAATTALAMTQRQVVAVESDDDNTAGVATSMSIGAMLVTTGSNEDGCDSDDGPNSDVAAAAASVEESDAAGDKNLATQPLNASAFSLTRGAAYGTPTMTKAVTTTTTKKSPGRSVHRKRHKSDHTIATPTLMGASSNPDLPTAPPPPPPGIFQRLFGMVATAPASSPPTLLADHGVHTAPLPSSSTDQMTAATLDRAVDTQPAQPSPNRRLLGELAPNNTIVATLPDDSTTTTTVPAKRQRPNKRRMGDALRDMIWR